MPSRSMTGGRALATFDVPPFLKEIPFECEKEYLALHGKLNRLTLYFGPLRKAERSVVILPEKKRLLSTGKVARAVKSVEKYRYIYDVNPAVVQAELFGEIDSRLHLFQFENKSYFLSAVKISSPFVKAYRILSVVDTSDAKKIEEELQKIGAGKVILRYKIDPQEYWKERNRLEQKLHGKKKVLLFKFEKAVLAEEV
ncbi:hypothetical protein HYX14_05340 [Candidatus Woesearchaeota archaeon]|nr:hypothetical protein [Candidatus Woesearchaeota archaeon]